MIKDKNMNTINIGDLVFIEVNGNYVPVGVIGFKDNKVILSQFGIFGGVKHEN